MPRHRKKGTSKSTAASTEIADLGRADQSPAEALHAAATLSNLERLRHVVTEGADVNSLEYGLTPLHSAVSYCQIASVRELVNLGANVNARDQATGKTPLLTAINHPSSDAMAIIEFLLANNADPAMADNDGWTPLIAAARRGNWPLVKLLLNTKKVVKWVQDLNQEPPNGVMSPLIAVVDAGSVEMTKLLLDSGANARQSCPMGTALHFAATLRNKTLCEMLLACGADPAAAAAKSVDRETPLSRYILLNSLLNVEMLRLLATPASVSASSGPLIATLIQKLPEGIPILIACGANINEPVQDMLPIYYASTEDQVRYLASLGADVNCHLHGVTALHALSTVMTWRNIDAPNVARALVQCGANVNARDVNYRTPLLVAAGANNVGLVDALAELGADLEARDRNGATLHDIMPQLPPLVKLLRGSRKEKLW